MGPVIDCSAQARIRMSLDNVAAHGAEIAFSGEGQEPAEGFFVGPVLLDRVTTSMVLFEEEIFGPVLSLVRPRNLDEAVAMMNRLPYGNGATIFTSSGSAACQFVREIQCGMIGVNIGVPTPMALFPFPGGMIPFTVISMFRVWRASISILVRKWCYPDGKRVMFVNKAGKL